MKLAEMRVPLFDLDLTLGCGQVFHWERRGRGWQGLVGSIPLYAEQEGPVLRVTEGREELAARTFALDHPLDRIYATFPRDDYSRAALRSCSGLRIMRQPRWECLATFITSSMKQVAHIRQMSLALRSRFGEPIPGSPIAAYPSPSSLASADEPALRACGLGYRAINLLKAARMVAAGEVDLDHVASLPDDGARRELCRLPGVGIKVANCALLFAFERLDAVPIDVWIGRVLRGLRGGRRGTPAQMERFARRKLGPYAGYVQQYLFHHARVSGTLPQA